MSISVWHTLQNGVLEPWSDLKLVVDTGKPEEEISVKGSDGGKRDCVKGRRSKLRVRDIYAFVLKIQDTNISAIPQAWHIYWRSQCDVIKACTIMKVML